MNVLQGLAGIILAFTALLFMGDAVLQFVFGKSLLGVLISLSMSILLGWFSIKLLSNSRGF